MSILVRYTPSNLTAEKYDATNKQIEQAGLEWPPDGLELHVCFGSDGNLRVSEIWESREQLEAFAGRLMPVLKDAGIEFSGEPEVLEIHSIEKPA
jgi:hypothetical protein